MDPWSIGGTHHGPCHGRHSLSRRDLETRLVFRPGWTPVSLTGPLPFLSTVSGPYRSPRVPCRGPDEVRETGTQGSLVWVVLTPGVWVYVL